MPGYDDRTTLYSTSQGQTMGTVVTVFDGQSNQLSFDLDSFGKDVISFGRGLGVDIRLTSSLVTHSKPHGFFVKWGGQWYCEDNASTNGLIYNHRAVSSIPVCDGGFVRIDDGVETVVNGVLMVFASGDSNNKWRTYPVSGATSYTIGRDQSCDIVLPHISISKIHAGITCEAGGYFISDCGSTNGVLLNSTRLVTKTKLHEKDVITITNSKLIFTSRAIHYCCYMSGISVDAVNIVINRRDKKTHRRFTTCNDVSLGIKPGELVAIIGGSGAGKSTVLEAMCGYLHPASGEVYINGIDLYKNFDSLKQLIGYVPQSDIVYDNLTLGDMLTYAAKLRLPKDTTKEERDIAVDRAIELVELTEKKSSYIKALSGGQRKRASIAVELISDPNLIFLDEPCSGLDPGTERNLMNSLREMADREKTVILVTHSTLQLKLCDKIVFMGKGGNLCYFGDYNSALRFFGVKDVVDIYNLMTDNAPTWSAKYRALQKASQRRDGEPDTVSKKKRKRWQLMTLSRRYFKLVINDRQRLLLLLVMAPLLAYLISLVADGQQFEQYEMAQSLLFALSCSAFWVGMFNSIQEVCKERTVLKREYMTGLSLNSYLFSKVIVLGFMCLIQSLLIMGVFAMAVGLPEEGLLMNSFLEMLITTFLTALSSMEMGLFVSSLFTNADKAMMVAPILLMPQLLFSGLIFDLEGPTEIISWFAICRWSVEGYGTTANLNDLPLRLQQEGIRISYIAEDFYEYTQDHLLRSWGILLLFGTVCMVLARIALSSLRREKG